MTPEYARMALPLIQALAEGKKLEFRTIGENVPWMPWIPNYTFFFGLNEYRVKVDPRAEWRAAVKEAVENYGGGCYQDDSVNANAAMAQLDELLDNIPKED